MYYPVPGHSHLKVLVPDVSRPGDSRPLGQSPGRLSQAAMSGRFGSPAPDPAELAAVSPLVRVALDAAFGIRDIRTLQERSFSYGVGAPGRARRGPGVLVLRYTRPRAPGSFIDGGGPPGRARRRTGAAPAGGVRVLSAHARGEGEYHGSATSGGRHYAWVARIADGRLLSFRVL